MIHARPRDAARIDSGLYNTYYIIYVKHKRCVEISYSLRFLVQRILPRPRYYDCPRDVVLNDIHIVYRVTVVVVVLVVFEVKTIE